MPVAGFSWDNGALICAKRKSFVTASRMAATAKAHKL
jgi:hypothetical protein